MEQSKSSEDAKNLNTPAHLRGNVQINVFSMVYQRTKMRGECCMNLKAIATSDLVSQKLWISFRLRVVLVLCWEKPASPLESKMCHIWVEGLCPFP